MKGGYDAHVVFVCLFSEQPPHKATYAGTASSLDVLSSEASLRSPSFLSLARPLPPSLGEMNGRIAVVAEVLRCLRVHATSRTGEEGGENMLTTAHGYGDTPCSDADSTVSRDGRVSEGGREGGGKGREGRAVP